MEDVAVGLNIFGASAIFKESDYNIIGVVVVWNRDVLVAYV